MYNNEYLNIVYQQKEGVILREIADETILVPICGEIANLERIFYLDNVSKYIWGQFDGKKTLEDISKEITREFDIKIETAFNDLLEYADQLKKEKLIGIA